MGRIVVAEPSVSDAEGKQIKQVVRHKVGKLPYFPPSLPFCLVRSVHLTTVSIFCLRLLDESVVQLVNDCFSTMFDPNH